MAWFFITMRHQAFFGFDGHDHNIIRLLEIQSVNGNSNSLMFPSDT